MFVRQSSSRRVPPLGGLGARGCLLATGLAALWSGAPARAAPPERVAPDPTAPAELARREAALLEQYKELERSFLRLADVLEPADPRRAAALRAAFARARDEQLGDRFGRIVTLLEQGQLLKAGTGQQGTLERLRDLLLQLEAQSGDRRLTDTKREVREYLARLGKLIARQHDVEGTTEAGGDEGDLAGRQRSLAEDAAALAADVGGLARRVDPARPAASPAADAPNVESTPASDAESAPASPAESRPAPADATPPAANGSGEPAAGPAPEGAPAAAAGDADAEAGAAPEPQGDDESARAERTRRRLEAAERRMRRAREQLDDARRREARAEQQQALEELEAARAELEQILRQVREEEVERLLVQLETRIRGMLRAERAVLAATEALADDDTRSRRERELEAARIGRDQGAVAADAARALALVRDDGSAVAVMEALGQVHDDALQAAARLGRGDAGPATRSIVADIVTGLEEMLAALEKARAAEPQQAAAPGGGRPAEPGEQPLVDAIAELKMLRALQLRVNTRTARFAQLLEDDREQADAPELVLALQRLAARQRAIERAARDIVAGRTE